MLICGWVALLTSTGRAHGAEAIRTASVDFNRVFKECYQGRLRSARLKELAQTFNQEYGLMKDKYNVESATLNRLRQELDDPRLDDASRTTRRGDIDAKSMELGRLKQQMDEYLRSHKATIADETQKNRADLIEEINAVVARKAGELGYSAVVDKSGYFLPYVWSSANGFGRFSSTAKPQSTKATDITDQILQVMNGQPPISGVGSSTNANPELPVRVPTSKSEAASTNASAAPPMHQSAPTPGSTALSP